MGEALPRVVTVALEEQPGALCASLPCGPGLRAGISLVAAGDMALSKRGLLPHRSRLLESLGVPPGRAVALRQVHSRRVIVVDPRQPPAADNPVEADGMVCAREDLLLTVTVADCLPIILLDTRSGAFGLVHSGWKGTGIAVQALRLMGSSFGTRAADVEATIGPGIGACCYAVPEDRARAFAAEFGAASVARLSDGRPALDLRAANASLLGEAGVESVTVVNDCTSHTPWLGSFRRQGPGDYTLMLAWVGPRP